MRLKSPARGVFDILQRSLENLRRPKAERLVLRGLARPVELVTDDWGVAHIQAESEADLFFAQGFVTARDRLFQLDYNRHAAAGRLCELVGRRPIPWQHLTVHLKERTTYDVDVMMRTFGLARSAEASLAVHSPEARAVLAAYAAGINAYIATGARTLEHRLLGARPEPWREVDSLTMLRAIGFELNFAWRAILLGALLGEARVPEDVARLLCPHYPTGGSTIVDDGQFAALVRDAAATRVAADVALGFGNAAGVGSNCVVVAKERSANGDALLANDTHLTLTAPLPWHEVQLSAPGLELHGFALAGVPGVGIGRTPHHAWGITAGLVQELDLFVERLHAQDPRQVLTPDGWQPLFERQERFVIKGEGAEVRTIYESRHGPLLETLATEPAPQHRLAIAWVGHRPGRDLDGLLQLWRAESLEQAVAALGHLVCPPYNISYADRDGRIAYVLAGAIPKRRVGTPLRPLEGWTDAWDWQGIIPFAENPRLIDPPRGTIVTANNRVAPPGYPYELGQLFEAPYRYDRLTALLDELDRPISVADLAAIQTDTFSRWGLEARAALMAIVSAEELVPEPQSREREALDLWLDWDGFADADSAGAALGTMVPLAVVRELVMRLAGPDAAFAWAELGAFTGETVLALPRLRERLAALGVDLPAVVRAGFDQVVARCSAAMGADPAGWQWGRMHPLVGRHRLDATPLGAFFAIGPEPAGGGPDTVNRGDVGPSRFDLKVGPAMRMVVSARDRDVGGSILPGGQSGDRLSRHYDDQLLDFLAGRLKPVTCTRERLAVARRELLVPDGFVEAPSPGGH